MTSTNFALAVRPGEHACCRVAQADDRERIAVAFVRDGLARGHKVIYLCDSDPEVFVAGLAQRDAQIEPALERGQLEVRAAIEFCCDDGSFDADKMLDRWRAEHARAIADGYAALSLTGEMTWALRGVPGAEQMPDYERRLPEVMTGDGSVAFLCQYDHGRFEAGTLAEAAEVHQVDVSPELAAIGRDGCLAAARVNPGSTLRLAGELDFGCSQTLAAVLDAHYHGDLSLDLADLRFIDVAGMRALRGRKGQRLKIVAASAGVRQLADLLAWDTDPDIEMAELIAA